MKLKYLFSMIVCAMILTSPVSADDDQKLGFQDFMPDDPIQDLKDMGVWSYVKLILGVLAILAIATALGAILLGMSFSNMGGMIKSTTMANHGSLTMIRAIIGIIVALVAISVVFYLWNAQ